MRWKRASRESGPSAPFATLRVPQGDFETQDDAATADQNGLENARVSRPKSNGRMLRPRRMAVNDPGQVVTGLRPSKSFVAVRLSMPNSSLCTNTAVSSEGLFTLLAALSTQVTARTQLRDLDFVSPASTGSYITTGVETRTPIECAPTPARPVFETESRVSHRTVTPSISSRSVVARPH